ncbi:hypothetical protein [Actinomadura sp. CNU-125]|nr:hypothetical protein [Actinomadura sp. CNU-125]
MDDKSNEEPDVEEIDVPPIPEPDEPEEGVLDPDDTYTEGPQA